MFFVWRLFVVFIECLVKFYLLEWNNGIGKLVSNSVIVVVNLGFVKVSVFFGKRFLLKKYRLKWMISVKVDKF